MEKENTARDEVRALVVPVNGEPPETILAREGDGEAR